MSELKITGTIEKFLDVQKGTTKEGKEWQKREFIVKTSDEYNNLFCFDVFGLEQVENLTKFNNVGDVVEVQFNVKCNEWKGKYYTSLSSWRIEKLEVVQQEAKSDDDLPF